MRSVSAKKWLPGKDSNLDRRTQNPLSYQLNDRAPRKVLEAFLINLATETLADKKMTGNPSLAAFVGLPERRSGRQKHRK
tara:strand:- start:52 stop:291 length:240 start_codon:yes stop_codon:yes gene_type:complete